MAVPVPRRPPSVAALPASAAAAASVSSSRTRARRASPSTQSRSGAAPRRSAAACASADGRDRVRSGSPGLEQGFREPKARIGPRPGDPGAVGGGDGRPPGIGIGTPAARRPRPSARAVMLATRPPKAAAPEIRSARVSGGRPRVTGSPRGGRGRGLVTMRAGEPRGVGLGAGGDGRELDGVEAVLRARQPIQSRGRGRRGGDRVVLGQGELGQAQVDGPGELRLLERIDQRPTRP